MIVPLTSGGLTDHPLQLPKGSIERVYRLRVNIYYIFFVPLLSTYGNIQFYIMYCNFLTLTTLLFFGIRGTDITE